MSKMIGPQAGARSRNLRLAAVLGLGAGLLTGCAGAGGSAPGAATTAGTPAGARAAAEAVKQAALNKASGDPCNEPAGLNYPSPSTPLNEVVPGLSPKALRAHKNGCAGLKFHIAPDGTTRDATLVVEQPPGFQFGKSALAALAETRYDPKQSNSDWYYLNTVFVQQDTGGTVARPDIQ